MKKTIRRIHENWRSGLTVSLIGIPLSIALAIAAGATPTQGIITAIWAGLIGALLGGSRVNIIGPTGALTGVLISYTITHGYQALPLIALLSGLLILIASYLHLERYITFIPKSVVYGFTLGIALIIAFGQLDNIFGLKDLPKTNNLFHNIIIALQHLPDFQWVIFGIFAVGLGFLLIWKKFIPKLPGAIVLTVCAITASYYFSSSNETIQSLLTIGEKYPDFQSQIFVNAWRDFSHTMLFDKDLWIISFATALISILETLLSGQIAAKMSKTPFDRSREMRSLGLANIGSGLLGGIPATAALARTALNIKSGGNHQTSGVLNALFTLIICVFAFTLFRWLPMVTVASILVMVAIGMVNKNYFTEFARNGRNAITLMLLVAAITFIIDPISGILIGSFIALLIFVEKNSTGQTEILLWNKGKMTEALMKRDFLDRSKIHSDLVVYKISGTLTYINMPAHLEAVKKIKDNEHVIISLRHAFYADHDGVDYLRELISILENQNKDVILCGINSEIKKWIQDETFYKERGRKKQIFKRTSEAIYQLYKE